MIAKGFVIYAVITATLLVGFVSQNLAKEVIETRLTTSLLKKTAFNLAETTVSDHDTLIASSYIPSMDWYVIAELPTEEAFASLAQANNKR